MSDQDLSGAVTLPPREVAATARPSVLASDVLAPAGAYALVLVVLLWSKLGVLATELPRDPNFYDAQLITWILSWVAHAALDPVATVFDANINFPSPAQLTGSDYFLSSQLLFAPLWWATGNPVLAVNLTTLATYWLAALCCERLLRAVGCRADVAFVCGLVFMLGPLQTPFNVHVLQYPIFLLPLLALALARLRERPDLARAAVVALVFSCGLLASMYAAVLLGVAALLWAAFELARPLPGRASFLALGLAAALVAALPLFAVLPSYLARAATQSLHEPTSLGSSMGDVLADPALLPLVVARLRIEIALVVLALPGLVGLVRGDAVARRLVPVGLACVVVAILLGGGVPTALRGTIAEDLFRFLRYTHRFGVVLSFGGTLLLAAGLTTVAGWLPARLARLVAVLVLVLVLVGKGSSLGGAATSEAVALGRDRGVHATVAEVVAANGPGPILQLPRYGHRFAGEGDRELLDLDAMLASTLHWQPLVTGYTGHQPAQSLLVRDLVRVLPNADALADLIDITHLRWILLRPADFWPADRPRAPVERGLRASPAIGQVWEIADWLLLQVVRAPQHESWFDAVASGHGGPRTVLGTPLAPLAAGSDVATVLAATELPERLVVKQLAQVELRIANLGSATWPVSAAPNPGLVLDLTAAAVVPRTLTVQLVERWIRAGDPTGSAPGRLIALRRDVAPGEVLRQKVLLIAPPEPGRYRLELSLEQLDGATFTTAGNRPLVQDVVVTSR